jgi:hypothetical protein
LEEPMGGKTPTVPFTNLPSTAARDAKTTGH